MSGDSEVKGMGREFVVMVGEFCWSFWLGDLRF